MSNCIYYDLIPNKCAILGQLPLSSDTVLGEVPNDVEDFIYKVLVCFEFIESGDLKKIDVIKKQANQLIIRYGLDK